MVRRVLRLIREESMTLWQEQLQQQQQDQQQQSRHSGPIQSHSAMYSLLGDLACQVDYSKISSHVSKPLFIQAINEMLDEMEALYSNISGQAMDHIHNK